MGTCIGYFVYPLFRAGQRPRCHPCGGRARHDHPAVISAASEHDPGEGREQPGGAPVLRQPAGHRAAQDALGTAG